MAAQYFIVWIYQILHIHSFVDGYWVFVVLSFGYCKYHIYEGRVRSDLLDFEVWVQLWSLKVSTLIGLSKDHYIIV